MLTHYAFITKKFIFFSRSAIAAIWHATIEGIRGTRRIIPGSHIVSDNL